MAFLVSPGVNTSEIDLTTSIPAVGTSTGATVGFFRWGPANTPIQVSTENNLVEYFYKPDDATAVSFLSAANFLSYGNDLRVVRVVNTTAGADRSNNAVGPATRSVTLSFNGVANVSSSSGLVEANTTVLTNLGPTVNSGYHLLTAGDTVTVNGESKIVLSVSSANVFTVTTNFTNNGQAITVAPSSVTRNNFSLILNDEDYFNNQYSASNASIAWAARFAGKLGNSLKVSVCANTAAFSTWPYAQFFDAAPTTSPYALNIANREVKDELHMVVVDNTGEFSGVANTVLERFSNLSKASDAKSDDGASIYYKEVIFRESRYVHWMGHAAGAGAANAWGQTIATANAAVVSGDVFHSPSHSTTTYTLGNGADGTPGTTGIIDAIDKFTNKEAYDISLLFAGDYGLSANASINPHTIANKYLDVAYGRKDCVAFISPTYANAVTSTTKSDSVIAFRNGLSGVSSYGVMDSGWKYQYDKYNDVYRWIPLNADIAGLCVRTDLERDPWFSPAGLNRGQIRNLVKLSFNPNQAERDSLYKKDVNPVVSFPGEGTILFGDKTLQGRPSAFDRINVRRLFIVLEKAISRAARSSLFEFNDEFTRAQFVALVEPFLRDVQGRRGIYDFRVVCDETNNTPAVIDRNEFVGDIYIKPARSVNFIQLNFVAVRGGVSFDEIVGRF
jgi:phage tail sheath protein FI